MRRGFSFLIMMGLLGSGSADAYVRSRSNACNPLYWPQRCVFVTIDAAGSADMTAEAILSASQKAVSSWSAKLPGSGSFMDLRLEPPSGNREATFDKIPVIKFRSNPCNCGQGPRWCRPAMGANGKDQCYEPSAAALTTVFFYDTPNDKSRDGQILDADIELNAFNNKFYNVGETVPPAGNRSPTDLWNTLTHELGHLMGLEHTCKATPGETSACTVDENGDAAPLCAQVSADPRLNTTTMFAVASPNEIIKRDPKADDLAGVTAAYPKGLWSAVDGKDPFNCVAPTKRDPNQLPFSGGGSSSSGGGCGGASMTGPPLTSLAGLAGLLSVFTVAGILRRRRIYRPAPPQNA